jgi:hypothetical protein
LAESSFRKVLKQFGLEYSYHRQEEDIYDGGPDRGRRIKNIMGGICSKVLSYEFPGINENISCNYSDASRIEAISRKLHISNIRNVQGVKGIGKNMILYSLKELIGQRLLAGSHLWCQRNEAQKH